MDTSKKITRRKFLGKIIAGTTGAIALPHLTAESKEGTSRPAAAAPRQVTVLPKRVLGRTKKKVSILGLGTASKSTPLSGKTVRHWRIPTPAFGGLIPVLS